MDVVNPRCDPPMVDMSATGSAVRRIALIGLLWALLCSACGGKVGPDGTPIPGGFGSGEVQADSVEDANSRQLTGEELAALAVFMAQAHLVEQEQLVGDSAPVVVVLDGKRWVVYHNGLYLETVGRTKQMIVDGGPGWANHNIPDWKLLVDWAKQQPQWPGE